MDVVVYIAQSIGLIPGRVWFGSNMAVNAALTAKQRRNFLRFLNRHGLKRFPVSESG
jgi:hypothetical protein